MDVVLIDALDDAADVIRSEHMAALVEENKDTNLTIDTTIKHHVQGFINDITALTTGTSYDVFIQLVNKLPAIQCAMGKGRVLARLLKYLDTDKCPQALRYAPGKPFSNLNKEDKVKFVSSRPAIGP